MRAEGAGRPRALGAIDLDCVDEITLPPDCQADYVVRIDGDRHAYCAFTARGDARAARARAGGGDRSRLPVPRRRARGPWFADRRARRRSCRTGSASSWASRWTERRVDLLPLVVEMLDDADEAEGLRALERRFRASYAFKVSDTHHVTVSPERLRALVRVVIELYQGVKPKRARKIRRFRLPAPRRSRTLSEALKRRARHSTWRDPAGVAERARTIAAEPRDVEAPATLRASLRPYQETGVAFLQHLRAADVGGVLADDMGLGKTLQTIAHLCVEKAGGRLTPLRSSSPPRASSGTGRASSRGSRLTCACSSCTARAPRRSRRSPRATSSSRPTRSSSTTRSRFATGALSSAHPRRGPGHQERAHRRRTARSARSHADAPALPHRDAHREPPRRAWSLFDFLSPGLLGDELAFRRCYRQPIEQRGRRGAPRGAPGAGRPVHPAAHEARRGEGAPPKTELPLPVELRGKQRELYEHIRVAAHADVRKVIRVEGPRRFGDPHPRRAHEAPAGVLRPATRRDGRRAGRARVGEARRAVRAVRARISTGKHRVLVFSQFTSMLALVAEGLRERGDRTWC